MNFPSSLVHFLRMGVDSSSAARVQGGPPQDVRCTSTKDHQAPSPPRSASRRSTRLSIHAQALPNMLIPMYPASSCFENIGRISFPEYVRRSLVSVTMLCSEIVDDLDAALEQFRLIANDLGRHTSEKVT